jgi:hypothetical protein
MPALTLAMPRVIRDPRTDPLPGDALRTPGGLVYRVLDRFVSTGGKSGDLPGVFCAIETDEGEERPVVFALGVFGAKMRSAEVVDVADHGDPSWDAVARHPQDRVDRILRREHGFE